MLVGGTWAPLISRWNLGTISRWVPLVGGTWEPLVGGTWGPLVGGTWVPLVGGTWVPLVGGTWEPLEGGTWVPLAVAEIHFFRWGGGGGRSLLNFRQNFQISDNPPHLHSKRLFLALL